MSEGQPQEARTTSVRRLGALLPIVLVAVGAGVVANLAMGAVDVSPARVLAILADHVGWHGLAEFTAQQDSVVWSIRLPRVVLGALVGAGLGVAGAALQGIFRNPLADPQLIGVSSGAALGAVLAIILADAGLGSPLTPLGGFVGAAVAGVVVYAAARHEGRTEVVTLVLVGIAVNAIAIAVVGFLSVAVDNQGLPSITFWSLGGLTSATWRVVRSTLPFVVVGLAVLPLYSRRLNLALLGEAEARHLGVNVEVLRASVLGIAALTVGGVVAASGVIGFVGLLAPHIVRLVSGPDHRVVLPASALTGAALVLWADLVARNVAIPSEVPVGLLTALVGGPFFIWLLSRTRREQGGWG